MGKLPATGPVVPPFPPFPVVVDIELTSRCNASCSFCPRDQTPHQGLMDEATFTTALRRAVEYRDALVELQKHRPGHFDTPDDSIWLSFCGMGEPLLHPRVVEYVGRAADAGLRPIVNTNGSLLSARTAEDLLDAGLAMACLNVGETGEQYEAVYRLPFERTRSNVEHFLAIAAGRCISLIILVDHRDDPDHASSMQQYWSDRGATGFLPFRLINRGGSLALDDRGDRWRARHREAERMLREKGGATECWVPFLYPFIGYDGSYHLCSSDWRKEVHLGNVFERSLVDLFDEKAEVVRTRSPICRDCSHEPTNALTRALADEGDDHAGQARAEVSSTPDRLLAGLDHYSGCVAAMRAGLSLDPTGRRPTSRRLIPVRS
ncbi:MAG: radical SAM protein [Acidimicrobiales bacterium]|jgi:MoaA/NifB/PqqE/SkfB family radical SAM enzyme|nr:radical SAM protein [Acidimicrobiales bacterium]HMS90118.1 radical SAM protein [Acidimicrobiales bacterium]